MERDYFGLTGVADKAIAMYNFNYRSDKPVDDSARRRNGVGPGPGDSYAGTCCPHSLLPGC